MSVCLCGVAGIAMQALSLSAPGELMTGLALSQASRLTMPLAPALAAALGVGFEGVLITLVRASVGEVIGSSFALAFAYLIVSAYRRLHEEHERTEALLTEVVAGRDASIHAAMLDEQAHLAREMHDILAHTLSALAVQLEGTRLLVEQRPGDPAAPAALARAGALAREGLEEATRAVGALRGGTLPGAEALPPSHVTRPSRVAAVWRACRCSCRPMRGWPFIARHRSP
jgi:signal transduction histidine kinase